MHILAISLKNFQVFFSHVVKNKIFLQLSGMFLWPVLKPRVSMKKQWLRSIFPAYSLRFNVVLTASSEFQLWMHWSIPTISQSPTDIFYFEGIVFWVAPLLFLLQPQLHDRVVGVMSHLTTLCWAANIFRVSTQLHTWLSHLLVSWQFFYFLL